MLSSVQVVEVTLPSRAREVLKLPPQLRQCAPRACSLALVKWVAVPLLVQVRAAGGRPS